MKASYNQKNLEITQGAQRKTYSRKMLENKPYCPIIYSFCFLLLRHAKSAEKLMRNTDAVGLSGCGGAQRSTRVMLTLCARNQTIRAHAFLLPCNNTQDKKIQLQHTTRGCQAMYLQIFNALCSINTTPTKLQKIITGRAVLGDYIKFFQSAETLFSQE